MKVALIGGSGFVGTRLIDLLQQDGNEILNIDKNQSHFFSKITTIGDVRDREQLTQLLKDTGMM